MKAARNGFTLVEVMVALLIFSLIAVACVAILAFSVTNREVVKASTDDTAALQRARQLLKADLGQVVGRGGAPGDAASASLTGGGEGRFLVVTRFVWTEVAGEPRGALRRIEYAVRDGRLERATYPAWRTDAPLSTQVLLTGVEGLQVRFVSAGNTAPRWPASDQRALPDAVVIDFATPRFGRMEQWFLVGSGAL